MGYSLFPAAQAGSRDLSTSVAAVLAGGNLDSTADKTLIYYVYKLIAVYTSNIYTH